METRITALLPRGPQTAVLPTNVAGAALTYNESGASFEVPRGTLEHPSFVNALPAVIAEPVALGYCEVCAWLASEICKADARGDWARMVDHARTGIGHVDAQHPECAS